MREKGERNGIRQKTAKFEAKAGEKSPAGVYKGSERGSLASQKLRSEEHSEKSNV